MTAFGDNTLPNLRRNVTDVFKNNEMIPVQGDILVSPDKACVAVPFDLVDISQNVLLKEGFPNDKLCVVLNDEKSAGFTEYYGWLKDDLHVSLFAIDKYVKRISILFENKSEKANYDLMKDLYDLLDEYKLSEYTKEKKVSRKKSKYEEDVQSSVKNAWIVLKTAKILINAENDFVSGYNSDGDEQVFLSSISEYHRIAKAAIVLSFITDNYRTLLEDSFGIKEFDNLEYVKGKVITKYSHLPKPVDINAEFVNEYTDDILQICRLMMTSSYLHEVQELIEDRCVILARTDADVLQLMRANDVYKTTSIEGADLRIYYAELGKRIAFLEEDFYREKGISIDSIIKLGIHITPIDEGPKSGNGIQAVGEFRPYMEFNYLRNNIEYIQEHMDSELAKKKSACILRIALENAYKMAGKAIVGSEENYETKEGISKSLDKLRKDDWLYSDGGLCYIEDISKNELDKDVYSEISLNRYSDQCKILGFATDDIEVTFDNVENLDKDVKQQLLTKLAKEFGVELSIDTGDGKDAVFNPEEFDMNEFPVRKVVNRERLNRYIENQFYAADPIRYKEVVVRQRTTGNRGINRSYAKGMYTNQFSKLICQGCRHMITDDQLYAVEIANYGIEMEQLTLCLCPMCYQKYEAIKKKRSDDYKTSVKRAIENSSILSEEPYYRIDVSRDMALYFTQIHMAELQNIFGLLDKYGVPMKEMDIQTDYDGKITGGKIDEIVVHDGEMIEYETMEDMKKHRVELDVDSYELHKAMDGRPIGVVFEFKDKKYRITQKF